MANKKNYCGWSNRFETKYGEMQSLKINIDQLRTIVKNAENEDVYLNIGETRNGALAIWEDEYKNRSDQSKYQKKKKEEEEAEEGGGNDDLPF